MDQPRRVEHQYTDKGYVPVYTTAVVEQPWAEYTDTEHQTWATLFERQMALLPGRACDEFFDGLARLQMSAQAIPRFSDLNPILKAATGWELIAVEGLLPELTFFEHLAAREFPVTWWIRKPEQIDYIEADDSGSRIYFNDFTNLLTNKLLSDLAAVMENSAFGLINTHLLVNLKNIQVEKTKPGKLIFQSGAELRMESEEVKKALRMLSPGGG